MPISRDWVSGRVVIDRAPVHVQDLAAASGEFRLGRAIAQRLNQRTRLGLPLLRQLAKSSARLCRADAAVIFRLEDGLYRLAAGYSLDPAYLEIERRTPIAPGPGTLIGRAAMSRQVVRIEERCRNPR
jgi:hypothetical protein